MREMIIPDLLSRKYVIKLYANPFYERVKNYVIT